MEEAPSPRQALLRHGAQSERELQLREQHAPGPARRLLAQHSELGAEFYDLAMLLGCTAAAPNRSAARLDDAAPSARLAPPTHPSAPPVPLGSLRWPHRARLRPPQS